MALRVAQVAMERYVRLVGEKLLEHVESIREGALAGLEPRLERGRDPEVEEAWLDFDAHLTALRVVHGERLAAKTLRARCLLAAFGEFKQLAGAKGMEVIERTDNL